MKARAVWFVAGSAVGVYASAKARRAAYRVSMPGLIDQAAALGTGWRAFAEEVRDGMSTAETRLADQITPPRPPLEAPTTDRSVAGRPVTDRSVAGRPELTDERDHP